MEKIKGFKSNRKPKLLLVETFVLALSYEEGRAERGGLKCFLEFSSAAVLDHECQQRPSYQRQAIGHQ